MQSARAKFFVGQVIRHKLFDYRGVIVDVDPCFMGTEDWYEQVALSRPPKSEPWYHVLVHESIHRTYVAEQNIEPDNYPEPIDHPEVDEYFSTFEKGVYKLRREEN